MSNPIHFAIIGGGWRAAFYLRIARALPDRFVIDGLVVRDEAKGAALEAAWQVCAYRSIDQLVAHTQPEFFVTSVPWEPNPGFVEQLVALGLAVLSETPPAPDLARLIQLSKLCAQGARIQVAEQYLFQPHHAARLAIVESGVLGRISEAQVSICHGYHGISLMRHFLSIGYENARISARSFNAPLIAGPDRDGPPTTEQVTTSNQVIASFDFGDRLGVYDFTGDQYFSWVRGQRLLVRGEKGELSDMRVSYLLDYATPMSYTLERQSAGENGNLEGNYLKGITGSGEWLYCNPCIPASLSDDEIAIATSLAKMGAWVRGQGPEPYPLAEACQDHYLNLMMEQALLTGQIIQTETQPWASA